MKVTKEQYRPPEDCHECIFNYDTIECKIPGEERHPDWDDDETEVPHGGKPFWCKVVAVDIWRKNE